MADMTTRKLTAAAIAHLEARLAEVKREIADLNGAAKPAGGILRGLDGRRFESVAKIQKL